MKDKTGKEIQDGDFGIYSNYYCFSLDQIVNGKYITLQTFEGDFYWSGPSNETYRESFTTIGKPKILSTLFGTK